jgi:hypothetical protein
MFSREKAGSSKFLSIFWPVMQIREDWHQCEAPIIAFHRRVKFLPRLY